MKITAMEVRIDTLDYMHLSAVTKRSCKDSGWRCAQSYFILSFAYRFCSRKQMLLSAASTVADQPVLMQGCVVVVNATTTEGETLRYTKWLDKLEGKKHHYVIS